MAETVTSVFKSFSMMERLDLNAAFSKRSLQPDEILFDLGDPSDSMFVVVSGRLEVISAELKDGRPQILVNVAEGESVGEIGFMTGKPHSAKVRAPGLTDVMVITRAGLDEFQKTKPLLAVTLYEAFLAQVIRRFRNLSDRKDLQSFWL